MGIGVADGKGVGVGDGVTRGSGNWSGMGCKLVAREIGLVQQ